MDLAVSEFGADLGPHVPWFLCRRSRHALDRLRLKEKASLPPGAETHPPRVYRPPPNFSTLSMQVKNGVEEMIFVSHQ